MIRRIIATDNYHGTTLLRLVLGVVFFAHGAQLMLGWFGGYGLQGSIRFFTTALHIPAAMAFLAIATEFFGGIALVAGFLARVAAVGIAIDMVVAVLMVHKQFGFFMNWFGDQKGEGYEFHLLAIAIAIYLILEGAGFASIDRLLTPASRSEAVQLADRHACNSAIRSR
jgi:putative oxidoreductase